MRNNSTELKYKSEISTHLQLVILAVLLTISFVGNILVIGIILGTKKLRNGSNLLLVNLAICDILYVIIGITFTAMIHFNYNNFEFNGHEFYCRIIWPLKNYVHNGSVFTIAVIAIERYLKMSQFYARFTKFISGWIIVAIHSVAGVVVIPYLYATYQNQFIIASTSNCFENWNKSHTQMYTIALFCLQYVVPLSTMILFYLSGWKRLYTHNNAMIKMSEEYEKKMNWRSFQYTTTPNSVSSASKPLLKSHNSSSYTSFRKSVIEYEDTGSNQNSVYCAIKDNDSNTGDQGTNGTKGTNGTQGTNGTTKDYTRNLLRRSHLSNTSNSSPTNCKNNGTVNQKNKIRQSIVSRYSSRQNSEAAFLQDSRKFLKSSFSSQTSYVRHRQSITTFKIFIIMIVAFACCALPIHLSRLNLLVQKVPKIFSEVAVLMSYSGAMINCWIYGGLNGGIREAICDVLLCSCSQNKPQSHISSAFLHMTTHPCFYDVKQQELFRKRFSAFNHMFEDFPFNENQTVDHNFNSDIKKEKSNEILTSHL